MKNQWPFWLFLTVIVVVVIFSFNYQRTARPGHVGEIFEDTAPTFEYEYVADKPGAALPADVKTVPVAPAPSAVTAKPVGSVAPAAAPVASAPAPSVSQPTATQTVVAAPAAPVATSPAPAVGEKLYVIQIVASKDQAKAQQTLEQVRAKGYPSAYLVTADLADKGTWYRIYIGGFRSKADAEGALTKVKPFYGDAFLRLLKS